MKNEIVKVEENQLVEVIKNSGLAIEEGEQIKQSYQPFLIQLSEIQGQANKINFDNPTEIDETIARELRLKTVKIRTGSADLKDSRKKIYLLKGNLEQAAYNLIAASCKITEEAFTQVEKAREIAEKKRKEELKLARIEKLSKFGVDTNFLDLLNMPEEMFDKLLFDSETSFNAKIEAEKKAEADKLEKERLDKLETERRIEIAPYVQFLTGSDDLRNMPDEKYSELLKSVISAKNDYEKKQEEIRLENERIKKEAEAEKARQEKILAEQKAEADKAAKTEAERNAKIQADLKAKADAEKKELEAKAKKEREEKEKLQAEKKEREALEAAEAAAKEAENKRLEQLRIEAEKAPLKEKLTLWVNNFDIICPESLRNNEITDEILAKFQAFKNWATIKINSL